ncbi:glycosyltransferase [Pedobacter chinensis]|uniref:Glycosyltransferase n=1 Tax=Pedobacter chinensis TaxID=2282421 RepID=A0A369PUI3_9SPHI|nr:glycosyltransferase [Pedobacter chinensis]RDC54296.1 glycosyltransferase [Pedobacter chinensis]
MKVLHICYSDGGGAGTAAVRLHKGLLQIGIESKMLVLNKKNRDENDIYEFPKKNIIFLLFIRVLKKIGFPQTLEHKNDNDYRNFSGHFEFFSFAKTSFSDLVNHHLVRDSDIINLHWVPNFVDYSSFFKTLKKPIVWTQHDMNAFQGGFHYKEDNLRNEHLKEIDHEQYECKRTGLSYLEDKDMVVVSPSKWMYNEASCSENLGRFKHVLIPNGIDQSIFKYTENHSIKQKMGLSEGKITVLFVSETVKSIRKGFNFIIELVNDPEITSKFEFIAVGNINMNQKLANIKYLGSINSQHDISAIYSAADIYLLPSREDNLPNVMLESLAVGTPVVGFNIGGLKDLIRNGVNGVLATEISLKGLRDALLSCAYNLKSFDRRQISKDIGKKYNLIVQANAYKAIYKEIIW